MNPELQALRDALTEWRATRKEVRPKPGKSPYGQQIYNLNMAWAKRREEIANMVEEERTAYQARLDRITPLHRQWNAEQAGKTKSPTPGSRSFTHPDAVKVAAARALEAGQSRSTIRSVLGVNSMEKADAILADGRALLAEQGGEGEEW